MAGFAIITNSGKTRASGRTRAEQAAQRRAAAWKERSKAKRPPKAIAALTAKYAEAK